MHRLVVLALIAALAGCGGDDEGSERQAGQSKGLTLAVSFDEPLRSGGPVTWTLQVENGGPDPLTLTFRSGKEGDVALVRGGQEAYRWSGTRYFTQAMRQVLLQPGERKTFTLEEKTLPAEAGDYELVAELDSEPAPPPVRRPVEIERA